VLAPAAADPAAHPAAPRTALDAESAFHQQLLEAFTTEAAERSNQCEELLLQLERRPGDRDLLDQLFRQLHTLKGAAAAIDLNAAAAQLHQGESLLESVRGGAATIDTGALVDLLLRIIDSVRGLIDRARGNTASPYAVIADVAAEVEALKGAAPERRVTPEAAGVSALLAGLPAATAPTVDSFLTEQLDAIAALRDQVSPSDVEDQLRQYIDALDQQARQFWQIATTLRERIQSLRLIPLEGVLRRLQRPLRDAARSEGKRASLQIVGGDVRVDRPVAERLYGPLMHLVRNAVSHGIEAPVTRAGRGKSDTGRVCIRAEHRADSVVVSVEDDGAGLDLAAIRSKAERLHWVEPMQAVEREALVQLIFRPGFSTREDATDIAGRGVGMDVVAHEIAALHGRVEVESRPGEGTTFRLMLPMAEASSPRPAVPGSLSTTAAGAALQTPILPAAPIGATPRQ